MPVWSQRFRSLLCQFQILADLLTAAEDHRALISSAGQLCIVFLSKLEDLERRHLALLVQALAGFRAC